MRIRGRPTKLVTILALGLAGLTTVSWFNERYLKESPKNYSYKVELPVRSRSSKIEQVVDAETGKIIKKVILPTPNYQGNMSVEEAISKRQVTRRYKKDPLTLEETSQLLWAAGGKNIVDGVTSATRTYPSASHTYPLEIYLIAGNVDGLEGGVYSYNWDDHSMSLIGEGDFREELYSKLPRQIPIRDSPISIVFASDTSQGYGKEGCYLDVGHAGQNVLLQAGALDLGALVIGGIRGDVAELIKQKIGLEEKTPIYVVPVGRKAD